MRRRLIIEANPCFLASWPVAFYTNGDIRAGCTLVKAEVVQRIIEFFMRTLNGNRGDAIKNVPFVFQVSNQREHRFAIVGWTARGTFFNFDGYIITELEMKRLIAIRDGLLRQEKIQLTKKPTRRKVQA